MDTRIVVEELPGSTRYTDPPGSPSVVHFRTLAALGGAVSLALIALLALLHPSRAEDLKQGVGITVVAVIFAMVAKQFLDCSRRFAERPVIVEVGRFGLGLNHPVSGTYFWPREEVSSVSHFSWLRIPGVAPDRFGGLLIRAGGKQFQILHGRPNAEITWLAEQLSTRLGIDTHQQT